MDGAINLMIGGCQDLVITMLKIMSKRIDTLWQAEEIIIVSCFIIKLTLVFLILPTPGPGSYATVT